MNKDSSSIDDGDDRLFSSGKGKDEELSSSSSSSTSASSSTSFSSENDEDEEPLRMRQRGRPIVYTINPITNGNIHLVCRATQYFYDIYQPCGQRIAAQLRVRISMNGQACFGLQLAADVKLSAFMSVFVLKLLRDRSLPIAMEIDGLPLAWRTADNTRKIASVDAIPGVVDELVAKHSDRATEGCFTEPLTVEMVSGKSLHVAFVGRLFGKLPWEDDAAFVAPPPSDEEIIAKMQQLVDEATESTKATYDSVKVEGRVLGEMKEVLAQIVQVNEADCKRMDEYHEAFELAVGELLEKMSEPPSPPTPSQPASPEEDSEDDQAKRGL